MSQRQRCPGPMDRRTFMKIGGLSLGALSTGADPSLARLLAAESATSGADKDFSVILFWAGGGPSQLDTFDLKPEAPQEIRGPFKPIPTSVPGMDICELLPNLARQGDRFALLRSLFHNRNEHSAGSGRFLSGYTPIAANPSDAEYPEIGAVVAKHFEAQARDIPLFCANNKFYGSGPAYLGPAYVPFMYSGDPNSPNFSVGNLTITQTAAQQLRKRTELLESFDSLRRDLDRSETMSALDRFNQQALDMLVSPRTRTAFDLSREPAAVRDRYGRTSWGQSLLLARRLVEAGVRFVQINATFPLNKSTGRVANWDDHSVNSDIFKAYGERMPVFDKVVPALLDDLWARGMDRNVLFIFCGEFGRTPKVRNQDASKRPGRDHWCQSMSVFLAGGGLKMGQVIGATNARAEFPVDRVMDSNCLLATLYRRFGIDTTTNHYDNAGRPIPILTDGEPIEELL